MLTEFVAPLAHVPVLGTCFSARYTCQDNKCSTVWMQQGQCKTPARRSDHHVLPARPPTCCGELNPAIRTLKPACPPRHLLLEPCVGVPWLLRMPGSVVAAAALPTASCQQQSLTRAPALLQHAPRPAMPLPAAWLLQAAQDKLRVQGCW